MKPIVFTIAPDAEAARKALGVGRSLRLIGDTTRRVVLTSEPDLPWLRSFHEVRAPSPAHDLASSVQTEIQHFLSHGFEPVLYVEPGALAFRRLDAFFEAVRSVPRAEDEARVLIAASLAITREYGTVTPDERLFAAPAVPVRLRVDIRTSTCRFISEGPCPRLVEPCLISLPATERMAYERALRTLEWLERYERSHGFGHLRPTLKLRRSIDKRILKVLGKR